MKKYVVFGRGFSGEYDTYNEALEVAEHHRKARGTNPVSAIYERVDCTELAHTAECQLRAADPKTQGPYCVTKLREELSL